MHPRGQVCQAPRSDDVLALTKLESRGSANGDGLNVAQTWLARAKARVDAENALDALSKSAIASRVVIQESLHGKAPGMIPAPPTDRTGRAILRSPP